MSTKKEEQKKPKFGQNKNLAVHLLAKGFFANVILWSQSYKKMKF